MSEINTPVIKTNAPPLRLISIIPNFLGKEDYLAGLITERQQRTAIRDYAMSYPLHPQGEDVMDKVRLMAASFRKLKALLAGKPVRLGVLFQSIVGHGGIWANTPGGPDFHRVIMKDGSKSVRVCPTGKLFRQYVHDAVALIAAEGPDFTLTDDDLRMSDNACFCDEHLRLFAQRMGRAYTREELVEALDNAEPHSRISIEFEDMQEKTMNEVCKIVRQTLDEFNPHLPCGCCLVCDRLNYAENQRAILKGDTDESFLRIGNGYYMENAIKAMVGSHHRTGYEVVNLRNKGFDLLDESDTCPHNRFSKSARTMHLHIATGILYGLDGCKLWLDQGACPMHEISRPYEDTIGKYQGFYRELHEIARQWNLQGLFTPVPAPDREPYPHHGIDFNRTTDWQLYAFGFMGFPTFYEKFSYDGIRLLAGKQSDYFTDDEIRVILAGKAILDAPTAVSLTKRGFAPLMGAAAVDNGASATSETTADGSLAAASGSVPTLTPEPGAEVLTTCISSAYRGAKPIPVTPGSTYFKNSLGGQVIVSTIDFAKFHTIHVVNPARKTLYMSWIAKLGGVPTLIPEMQDSHLICGELPTGDLVCAVFNYSYDPLEVKLAMSRAPRKAFELLPEGDYREIPVSWENGIAAVPKTLEPAIFTVLKFAF